MQVLTQNGSVVTVSGKALTYTASGGGGGGTVTIVGTGTGLVGGPITSSGTISLATAYGDIVAPYGNKAANLVLASPDGTSGVPSFRSLTMNDLPDLSSTYVPLNNSNKINASYLPSYVDDVIEGYYHNSKFYGKNKKGL